MSETPDPRSRLIAELFHGDWKDGASAGIARRAALVARRRHMGRVASAIVAAAAVAIAIVFACLGRSGHRQAIRPSEGTSIGAPAIGHPGYEVISDDELIAEVHDRPLLILGTKAEGRKIVLIQL